jgi:hypothetical protein
VRKDERAAKKVLKIVDQATKKFMEKSVKDTKGGDA